jgi:branched-chain amino acid transport system substrate-binding protein
MLMRVEAANAGGGIHGRKLRLVVEDSGYDTRKSVLAADKLVTSDKVFAVIGTLGTAPGVATAPAIVDAGVLHLFPITAHHAMFEPFHKLKFAAFTPYPDSTRAGLREMIARKNYKRVAILYQDDEYGLEILSGTEAALKDARLALVERASYKRGATDFATQMQKLKAANPDLIVLATVVRETIGSVSEARKLGYTGDFIGSPGSYIPAVPKLGGKALEGMYNLNEISNPYRDDPANSKLLNEWMDAYKARFGQEAELWGVMGWTVLDMFVKAAEKAGPALSTDALVKALESSTFPRSFLGAPEYSFGPKKRLGNNQSRIAQAQNGRWVNITDYVK